MIVGSLELHLRIDGAFSLKEKRRVLRSILDKARNDFHVAASEVADHDLWNSAVLGFACVSNDAAHAESVLSSLVDMVEGRPDVEVEAAIQEIERR